MIRIDAVWLATAPVDMRSGYDSTMARVIAVFGAATPHHAYLFANRRGNRIKVLVHDGIGIWLAARRLYEGKFVWPSAAVATGIKAGALPATLPLSSEQLQALVLGLPWQRIGAQGVIKAW